MDDLPAIEQLLDQLDQSREKLLMAIELLPDEALLQADVIDNWSIADLLVVLSAWESETVTALMQIKKGKKPAKLLVALANPVAYNAQFTPNAKRNLDQVFDDFQRVRTQLEAWLESFSEKELLRRKWLQGQALVDIIKAATTENETQYIPTLTTFAQDQAKDVIPLATVFVEHKDEKSN